MLFFPVCFSLFGQTSGQTSEKLNIFVLPIAGYGRDKDNDYFFKQLAYEIFFQNHRVADSRDSSKYIFKGTIEPVSGVPVKEQVPDHAGQTDNYNLIPEYAVPPVKNAPGRREFFSVEKKDEIFFLDSTGDNNALFSEIKAQAQEEGYYFILEMLDSATGDVIGSQKILFSVTDDYVSKLVYFIVHNLLSNIPETPPKRGDSRDRWMYFETSALWMPRIYYGGYELINLLGFGMKFGVEVRFLDFMSLGVGAQITQEQISVSDMSAAELVLELPVAIKYVLKIENNYALEPYGGAALNYSIDKKIQISEFSWFAGVQFGIKDKSETGMFVIDPRFAMDLFNSVYPAGNIEYQRYSFQLGLGYKFGAFQKKR